MIAALPTQSQVVAPDNKDARWREHAPVHYFIGAMAPDGSIPDVFKELRHTRVLCGDCDSRDETRLPHKHTRSREKPDLPDDF